MSRMLKSSGAMGAATLASRVLGLAREQVYAAFMGVTAEAGAFYVAFTIPSLFRRLLGEGALTAAYIPIFKEKERTATPDQMWRSANAVISGLWVTALGLVLAGLAGLTLVLRAAPLGENTRLMLELLRVMFPYVLLVCVAALFMGTLNARGYFFVPSLGAALLNVIMIGSVLWLAPRMGATLRAQVFGLAVGVLIAGLAQAGFQIPWLRREGWRYRWTSPWRDPTVRQVVRKMIPGSIGVAAFQINVLVTQLLAFGVHEPIVAAFNFAVRLMEFPQGIFGISLATYLLPTLSGLAAEKDYGEFRRTLREGLGYVLFLNMVSAALLVVLAEPMIRLLFEWGRFSRAATPEVALALACLAPGLVAYSVVNILARAFYALGNTRTPMQISVFCLVVNLGFAVLLLPTFHAAGLGVANAITSYLNAALLLYALRRRLGRLDLRPLLRPLIWVIVATMLAGLVAWGTSALWSARFSDDALPGRLGAVFVPLTVAVAVYLVLLLAARVSMVKDLLSVMRRGDRT